MRGCCGSVTQSEPLLLGGGSTGSLAQSILPVITSVCVYHCHYCPSLNIPYSITDTFPPFSSSLLCVCDVLNTSMCARVYYGMAHLQFHYTSTHHWTSVGSVRMAAAIRCQPKTWQ